MDEPAPIDHKDETGEYRDQVRAGVFSRVEAPGQPVASRDQVAGSWDVAFVGLGPAPTPMFVYHLREDGKATIEVVAQAGLTSVGEWRLNPDGTFSLLTRYPPDPALGIDEPQTEDDRRHVAALPGGRLVMWNGDGSLTLLLSPRRG
jgi:hypothetical protein